MHGQFYPKLAAVAGKLPFLLELSKLTNKFVQIMKYICPNCQLYLSKLQGVFEAFAVKLFNRQQATLAENIWSILPWSLVTKHVHGLDFRYKYRNINVIEQTALCFKTSQKGLLVLKQKKNPALEVHHPT